MDLLVFATIPGNTNIIQCRYHYVLKVAVRRSPVEQVLFQSSSKFFILFFFLISYNSEIRIIYRTEVSARGYSTILHVWRCRLVQLNIERQ